MPEEYPRTPHLPFSPQVADDDITRVETADDPLLNTEVIITEKLDGGNCCLSSGKVYARTHGQEATHGSFDWVKGFYSQFSWWDGLDGLSLFGENLQGVHSIEYTGLKSFFYLFAVRDESSNTWLSWDAMTKLVAAIETATSIDIPIVPVLHRGTFTAMKQIESLLTASANTPSSVGGTREGFVVRTTSAIPCDCFDTYTAKYVRKGHIQTKPDWKRTWKQASLVGG
eukprot:TRINITY_DN12002_c0_g1_i2.p1 TRINITY_DN12002_c0_g1~~TRINITY_DN12002_c0_g1_i2.p1  ORF type:complete len:227 (+),score=16.15 TRINITY_DN12002_c0_g1_i2:36-716(+)